MFLLHQQAKEKERRLKMKEEKLKLLREHQEERIRKSLERAKAEPKKIVSCFLKITLAILTSLFPYTNTVQKHFIFLKFKQG